MLQAAEYIRKNSSAGDWTFSAVTNDHSRTRFAQNGITQHISGQKAGFSLSVSFDAQTGSASCNDTSQEGLNFLIKTAETIARRNQPDPEFVPSEPAKILPESNDYAESTDLLSPEDLVDIVQKCVENADKKGAKTSGMTEKDTGFAGLFTKNGFEGFHHSTDFSHSMTMSKGGVETKINRSMLDYNDFDLNLIIELINGQFDNLSDPEPIEPVAMPVIMRPSAVADWFIYLLWMLDRRQADEGLTPFTGQLGNQFFGEKFSLKSVLNNQGLASPPFSGEGLASQNMNWINKGVIENMITSRYYAKEIGESPNFPYNVFIEGDNSTEEEMMNMVPRGVILNKLWYIRDIDRKSGSQTGLTRDGVLYFENGKIVKSVNNFRWNDTLHEVTRRIIALGKSELIESWCQVPAILVDNFNFVDTTSF